MGGANSWLVWAVLVAALSLTAGPAGADREPPRLYEMRVVLTTNEVIPGQGWGTFGGPDSERRLRLVEVEPRRGYIRFTYHYADAEEPVVRNATVPPETTTLSVVEGHQRFDLPGNRVFFLPRQKRRIPVTKVRRVEYVEVIGRGFPIAEDPNIFLSVPEPFLAVHDCAQRCAQKLRSRDRAVTREMLQKLWGEHFSCEKRGRFRPHTKLSPDDWGDPEKFGLFHEHQLEMVSDPTCHAPRLTGG